MKKAAMGAVLLTVTVFAFSRLCAEPADLTVRPFSLSLPGLGSIEQSDRDLPVVGQADVVVAGGGGGWRRCGAPRGGGGYVGHLAREPQLSGPRTDGDVPVQGRSAGPARFHASSSSHVCGVGQSGRGYRERPESRQAWALPSREGCEQASDSGLLVLAGERRGLPGVNRYAGSFSVGAAVARSCSPRP